MPMSVGVRRLTVPAISKLFSGIRCGFEVAHVLINNPSSGRKAGFWRGKEELIHVDQYGILPKYEVRRKASCRVGRITQDGQACVAVIISITTKIPPPKPPSRAKDSKTESWF
ncbi:hypothetical protein BDDG_06749 [Blastomyces dermatitidis ATCC 18188]|uniref:Uncharacterized protein n=1 Tax=Ajellomyces dermatitidis (strain ATCC 18188 / CBS 674.68) TaxID=653446 RepID=F2TKP1_AJEDA|nr:hypothetical protein BDDG_06749 [Blastomyces dermatitidis ATCC 18188]